MSHLVLNTKVHGHERTRRKHGILRAQTDKKLYLVNLPDRKSIKTGHCMWNRKDCLESKGFCRM